MNDIGAEKYVRLTTFTKGGDRKETPVWIADPGDGSVGFTTDSDTWKLKRINHTPTAELTGRHGFRQQRRGGALTVAGLLTTADVREDGLDRAHS